MKEKISDKLTIRIASLIHKTLHSRDSADRLVGTILSTWRARSDWHRKNLTTLVLDFESIAELSESAASALAEFHLEFLQDKNLAIEFSNMSDPVRKIFAAAEKSLRRFRKGINAGKKKSGFMIEI